MFSLALGLSSCGDSWIETYDPGSDEPYGTSLLPEVLKTRYPSAEYQELYRNWTVKGIPESDSTLYIAIGNGLLYTQSEADAVASFVEQGGEAFLAAKEISNTLLNFIVADSCLGIKDLLPYNQLDSLEKVVSAAGSSFQMPVIRKRRGAGSNGNYIDAVAYDCLLGAEHLLMIQHDTSDRGFNYELEYIDQPIMTRFAHGQGHITLLSHPIVLTNVFATDSLGRGAMEEVLKLLPSDVSLIAFDRQRRSSESAVIQDNIPKDKKEGFDDESNILKHVLARPPLATAWYLLLLGSVVFLIFGAKRRQRLIPLVQPRRNTTHEHLGNISRLYLSQPNNALMASKQFALFEAYCQRRFGLRPLQNEADFDRFSKMAGVNLQYLETLKRYHSTIARKQPISNTGFVSIVRILQALYKGIGRRFD
jgi:hypothetical protein